MTAPTPPGIRAARPDDRDSIIDIARASGLFPPDDLADVADLLDAFLTGSVGDDSWVVQTVSSTVVAIAYYAPERMTEGTWNLYLLAVHPDHQGHGHGSTLVDHIQTALQRTGARVLLIETSGRPDFAGQRAFYARLGYHEEARIREFYAAGDDKIVYWRHLQ